VYEVYTVQLYHYSEYPSLAPSVTAALLISLAFNQEHAMHMHAHANQDTPTSGRGAW
jgi:hypothetical protein